MVKSETRWRPVFFWHGAVESGRTDIERKDCLSNSHNSSTPDVQSTPGTARFFVSLPAVAMPNELSAGAEAGGAPDGAAEDAYIDGILNNEELEQVRQRTAEGWKASRERRRRCCSRRPRGGSQDGPSPDLSSFIKKTPWIGWTVNSIEWAPSRNGSQKRAMQIFSWLKKLTCSTTLKLQRRPGCDRKDGGRALRLRSPGRRSMASGSPPSRRRSKGSAGVTVAAALRHGLASPHGGVGDRSIGLCKRRVLAFHQSGVVPGGALILSVYMHTGAGLTQIGQ